MGHWINENCRFIYFGKHYKHYMEIITYTSVIERENNILEKELTTEIETFERDYFRQKLWRSIE